MDHLGAEESLAQLAQQPQPRSRDELLLLAGVKVEEAQVQYLVAIADPTYEHPFGTEFDPGLLDIGLDLNVSLRRIAQAVPAWFRLRSAGEMQHEINSRRQASRAWTATTPGHWRGPTWQEVCHQTRSPRCL
jgi:hypothetical protein